jgi:hypothetical protein
MPMPLFFTPDQEAEVVAEYNAGSSSTKLARKWGCNSQTILNVLARRGVDARSKSQRNIAKYRKWTPEELAEIKQLWESGVARTALARRFACGIETISRALSVHLGFDGATRRFRSQTTHPSWRGGRRVTSNGYITVRLPKDHRFAELASDDGAVPEHRLVMAEQLGRPLARWETVHHINGVKTDNRPDNLQLRSGNHGKGVALKCRKCGSHDIEAIPLSDAETQ